MSFWWAFCITLVAGYNGSLMSFMANPGLNPALDTISQLVDAVRYGRIAVGTIQDSAEYAVFKHSEEPDLRLLLENMESDPHNLVSHDSDGLVECLRRQYAYIGGQLTVWADVWDARLFLFSRDFFLQYGYAIAFAPGFEYIETFDRRILQLREAGLIQKWITRIIERNQVNGLLKDDQVIHNKDEEDTTHILRMDDVQGAFTVLGIGLALASLTCFIEWQVKR
ncbi:uncharacterized protein LOC118189613 [Stegodyphus dumicola]|uniref:uncharacterized protein LOC118189613 n=1 Tax=Stegodyphus dumicola TaxID=202533 RepID=UPI0015A89974|nr:uncharacterized protein LOC118189613 [Stegodyphus dumicola]